MAAVPVEEGWSPRLRLALLRAFELRRGGERVRLPWAHSGSSRSLPSGTGRCTGSTSRGRYGWTHRRSGQGQISARRCGACGRPTASSSRRRHAHRLGPSVKVDVHETLAQAKRLLDQSAECELSSPRGLGSARSCFRTGTTTGSCSSKSAFGRCGCTRSRRSASGSRRRAASARRDRSGSRAVAAEPLRESAQRR